MKKDGGAAFPRTGSGGTTKQQGMTLRDYFAGQALTGLNAFHVETAAVAARYAYGQADAMIIERDKT